MFFVLFCFGLFVCCFSFVCFDLGFFVVLVLVFVCYFLFTLRELIKKLVSIIHLKEWQLFLHSVLQLQYCILEHVKHGRFFLGLVLCLWNHWEILLYIKNHNKIHFSGRDSCLVIYFVCSFLDILHREKSVLPKCTKCEQKPDQSSTTCGQEIHGMILS